MIQRAYHEAVARLRRDPHFVPPIPTSLEVAALYRRAVPGASLSEVRTYIAHARLPVADWTPEPEVRRHGS